jgi:hypothetical protein
MLERGKFTSSIQLVDNLDGKKSTMKTKMLSAGLLFVLTISSFCGRPLLAQQNVAPEKVVGRESCAQCHGPELKAWEQSSHNKKAWSLLEHPKAPEFAKAIDVTDIKGDSACTKCHGTHQMLNGQLKILQGNSCESCHGGAGGADGWLKKHYDFGQGGAKMADLLAERLKETAEQRAQRDAACTEAGMNRSENAMAIAKNCLSCHLVPNEALLKAGHPMSSSFELVEWSNGEVRHNFLLDANKNNEAPSNWLDEFRNGPGRTVEGRKRLMYIAGKLADLEVSLRIRGGVTSTKRGTLGDEMNDRILDIQEELEEFEIDDLKAVVDATKDVKKKSLRKITDQDKTTYAGVADAVAKAAKTFVTANASGDKLPAKIKVRNKVKGEPSTGK